MCCLSGVQKESTYEKSFLTYCRGDNVRNHILAAGTLNAQEYQTDAKNNLNITKAEIYSYSRSKGAFAGVALKGAVIAPDIKANRSHYGNVWKPEDILIHRKVKPKGSALDLAGVLEKFIK